MDSLTFVCVVFQEGYSVMVLNPNENHLEVERPAKPTPLPSPEVSDEPAEKRERKDDRESKKKRDFYEKYRNPQKEGETEQIPIRVSEGGAVVEGDKKVIDSDLKERMGEVDGESLGLREVEKGEGYRGRKERREGG